MLTHQWFTGLAAIVTHMRTISLFGMHGIDKRGLFCKTNMIVFNERLMHQSFVSPAPLGPGIPGT